MSENKTIDEIPDEVLQALQAETGAPNPREPEPAPVPPPAQDSTLRDVPPTTEQQILQIISGLNRLGQEIQSTQAAVLRAQVRTQIFEEQIMDLAVAVRELKKDSSREA